MRSGAFGVVALSMGVPLGGWMHWMGWLGYPPPPPPPPSQHFIEIEVTKQGQANLLVYKGDVIQFRTGAQPSQDDANIVMHIENDDPLCANESNHEVKQKCVVVDPQGSITAETFKFTCYSPAGYSCPDPGIKQRSTSGTDDEIALASAGGASKTRAGERPSREPVPASKGAIAPGSANILCNGKKTSVYPTGTSGSKDALAVYKGQDFTWVASSDFTLSKLPTGTCTQSTQKAQQDAQSGDYFVSCKIDSKSSSKPYKYSASLSTCADSATGNTEENLQVSKPPAVLARD
jgi:hypothetical protein